MVAKPWNPPPRDSVPDPPPIKQPPIDEQDLLDRLYAKMKADRDYWRGEAGADGKPGRDGQEGDPGQDFNQGAIDRLASQVALLGSGITTIENDLSELTAAWASDVSDINGRLAALEDNKPVPSPPRGENHLVLIADQTADYWERLESEYERARGYYSALRLAPPPNFSVPLPQLIAYTNGTPQKEIRGLRSVSEALNLIARGEWRLNSESSPTGE